ISSERQRTPTAPQLQAPPATPPAQAAVAGGAPAHVPRPQQPLRERRQTPKPALRRARGPPPPWGVGGARRRPRPPPSTPRGAPPLLPIRPPPEPGLQLPRRRYLLARPRTAPPQRDLPRCLRGATYSRPHHGGRLPAPLPARGPRHPDGRSQPPARPRLAASARRLPGARHHRGRWQFGGD